MTKSQEEVDAEAKRKARPSGLSLAAGSAQETSNEKPPPAAAAAKGKGAATLPSTKPGAVAVSATTESETKGKGSRGSSLQMAPAAHASRPGAVASTSTDNPKSASLQMAPGVASSSSASSTNANLPTTSTVADEKSRYRTERVSGRQEQRERSKGSTTESTPGAVASQGPAKSKVNLSLQVAPGAHLEDSAPKGKSEKAKGTKKVRPSHRSSNRDYDTAEAEDDDDSSDDETGVVGAVAVHGINASAEELDDLHDEYDQNYQEHEVEKSLEKSPKTNMEPSPSDRNLAVAIAIDEEAEQLELIEKDLGNVISAEEVNEAEEEKGLRGWILRNKGFSAVMLVLIIAAIVTGSSLAATAGRSRPSPTQQVFNEGSERFQAAANLILNNNVSEEVLLLSPERDTPQYLALDWISNEDDVFLEELEEEDLDENGIDLSRFTQRYTMAVFYYATDGPTWIEEGDFLAASNECDWGSNATDIFLGCNDDGFLTCLNLPLNNLNGTIPSEIVQLVALKSLELACSEESVEAGFALRGPLPSSIGNLTDLHTLIVDNCALTGTIPSEMGQVATLLEWSMVGNDLSGALPSTVGGLTDLFRLELYENNLDGTIPSEIGLMTSLQILDMHDNQLEGSIPDTIANLGALMQVDFSFNSLNDGGNNLCAEDDAFASPLFSSLDVYLVDCYNSLVPAIAREVDCCCCTACCSDEIGTCDFLSNNC